MTTTLYATYDGEVLRPEGPVPLEPDTRVRVTLEVEEAEAPATGVDNPYGWLDFLESANLDGPPDWSERLHEYLYGEGARRDG